MVMGKRQLSVNVAHLNQSRLELVFHLEPDVCRPKNVYASKAKLNLWRVQLHQGFYLLVHSRPSPYQSHQGLFYASQVLYEDVEPKA
jgi:hypothetical protein